VHLKPRGGIAIFYDAGPPTPGAQPLLGKMPWFEDRPTSFACTGSLPPNCTLFGRVDCVRFMIAWPDGPNRSRTMIYHLFPEAFFERPGFRDTLRVYHDYQLQILEEDRSMTSRCRSRWPRRPTGRGASRCTTTGTAISRGRTTR
jgi:Rieske 2Fe-2S family protein